MSGDYRVSQWSALFKSEVRQSGAKLAAQEKVKIAGGSDRTIHAYVQGVPSCSVVLSADGIAGTAIDAQCTCPLGQSERKPQFCKHVWATILVAMPRFEDFFAEKQTLHKSVNATSDPRAQKRQEVAQAQKERARESSRTQYERQKQRARERKLGRPAAARQKPDARASYPEPIQRVVAYFALNGFSMEPEITEAEIREAKRTLSRVFHPDRGGSHAEIVELNQNAELLLRFFREG